MNKTAFETDLEAYFPDIYKLHLLGKEDKKLWIAIYELMKIMKEKGYAEVKISVQDGFINRITTSTTK